MPEKWIDIYGRSENGKYVSNRDLVVITNFAYRAFDQKIKVSKDESKVELIQPSGSSFILPNAPTVMSLESKDFVRIVDMTGCRLLVEPTKMKDGRFFMAIRTRPPFDECVFITEHSDGILVAASIGKHGQIWARAEISKDIMLS
jgi:hypothetical protein